VPLVIKNKTIFSLLLFILVMLSMPVLANAHSSFQKTAPENQQELYESPSRVDIWFKEPVDVYSGSINVTISGIEVHKGRPVVDSQNSLHISIALEEGIPPGVYTVRVDVMSKDGHPLRESFFFTLKDKKDKGNKVTLVRSIPEDGTILTSSPDRIELQFTDSITVEALGLFDAKGNAMKVNEPVVDPDRAGRVYYNLEQPLPPGTYTVRWITPDPHGIFYFAVQEGPSIILEGKKRFKLLNGFDVRLQDIAQWFTFLGVIVLSGGAWFAWAIAKGLGNYRRWDRIGQGLSVIGAAGFIMILAGRAEQFDGTLTELLMLKSGWLPLVQLLLLTVGVWFASGTTRLGLLALSLLVYAFTGHSASPEYGGSLGIIVDAMHLLAVSIWLGGLVALVAMTPKEDRINWFKEAGSRFSRWAIWSIVVITITGIWMAADYLQTFTWETFFASEWGRALFVKVLLFTGIIGIGFLQRNWIRQLAMERLPSFIRRSWLEMVIGACILLLAAVLIDLSPSAAQREIYPAKVTSNGIEAALHISPLQTGMNETTIRFTGDPQFEKVLVSYFMPPDWKTEVKAFSLGGGEYRVVGNQLHAAGNMYIEVKGIKEDGTSEAYLFRVQVPGEMRR
jgi:copper transport protein